MCHVRSLCVFHDVIRCSHFPTEPGSFKNFGLMSVTCKAVDEIEGFQQYMLEVCGLQSPCILSRLFSCYPMAAPTRTSFL